MTEPAAPLTDEEIRQRFHMEPGRTGWMPLADDRRRTSWTARDLLSTEFPEPRYAVPDLIPEGLSFLVGAPKLGQIVAHAQRGDRRRQRGPSARQGQGRSRRRVVFGARGHPAPAQEPPPARPERWGRAEGLAFETDWPRLAEDGAEQIGAWLADHPDARLVVVDVFSRLRPRLDNDRADRFMADYSAGGALKAIADTHQVAVVALHHTRKASAEDFVDAISGTHGLAAAADTIMVAKRGRGQADATLHVTGRDVEEQELALKFDPALGIWTLLGDASEYAIGETRKAILDAVRDHGSLSPKEAAGVTGVSPDLARQTMRRMAADGQLIGKDGRYYPPALPVTAVTQSLQEGIEGDTEGEVSLAVESDGDTVTGVTPPTGRGERREP